MRIGEAIIEPVIEVEEIRVPAEHWFPGRLTPAFAAENRAWLEPQFYDFSTHTLPARHQSWLARVGGFNILVDPCLGNGKPINDPVFAPLNMLNVPFLERMAAAGARAENVDFVICTHMHIDHCGWNTQLVNGRWMPSFPNARYIFSRDEYEFWAGEYAPGGRGTSRLAFNRPAFENSILPVIEAGQAMLWDGRNSNQLPGLLSIESAPGHTPGNTLPIMHCGGHEEVLFAGDILHHPVEIYRHDWHLPGIDGRGEGNRIDADASRLRLLERAADRGSWVLPAHFPIAEAVRIARRDDGGFAMWTCKTGQD